MEVLANNQENQPQPPTEAVPTSAVLDGAPKKRNYIPWILGILVLIVIFTTSFLILTGKSKPAPTDSLTQPPVPQEQAAVAATNINMSSWRTYTNPSLGITLQYPSNWTVNTDDQNAKVAITADQNQDNPSMGIKISSLNRQGYISLNNWLTEKDKDCEEAKQLSEKTEGPTDCFQYERLGERKVNTYTSSKILWNCCGSGPTVRYFIESPDKIYFIDLSQDFENFNLNTTGDYDEDNSKLAKIYQQILSTFKFTNTQIESVDNIDQLTKLPVVPVYPQAKFTKKEFIPSCPGEQAVCNVDSYTWEFSGNIDEVISWYEQDQSKSGWKLSGGAGLEGTNRYGSFSNGKVRYWLTIYLLGPEGPVGIELRGPLN